MISGNSAFVWIGDAVPVQHAEVIDLSGDNLICDTFPTPDFPRTYESYHHIIGGLLDGKTPMLCGPEYLGSPEFNNQCFVLGQKEPLGVYYNRLWGSSAIVTNNKVRGHP